MKKFLIFMVLMLIFSFAQPFHEGDPREIIEKVKIYRLTKELDLSTDQATKFFPRLNEYQKEERNFRERKGEILDELKGLLRREAPESKITPLLKEYEELLKEHAQTQIKRIKEMWQILTPIQRAKYLIFEDEFRQEIKQMIKEIRRHRREKPED
ncbi:hypothetical protein BXT86_02100 [candidate division WOR-3 bacterium 4484_100]|uniref:Periplasmic heavy metal sensor n=1 Tax=candidate division WOR-3 bacterium 4484_100 TaxID=1936077 RepID=A0A1V4QGZ3_UNCW3|nr:MAG: hypothetical protein BXT86_02100 [candidate division WOR-3 bacterium 4484_100]